MTKACAKTFLIVFGNLLIFAVPLAVLFFPGLHTFSVLFMLAVFAAHVVGSVFSCRRFKCRFGVTPGRYVMCGALPAFALNLAFAVFAIIFLCSAGAWVTWFISLLSFQYFAADIHCFI